jgi:ATP-dependent helicase HrpB
VARRISDEQGWTLGREVGWHVRFERRFTVDTRVLVVTEGMLTAYLDDDPLLGDVSTVVLDEFHERSLHTDIGLALVKQAWLARTDLRVLVMSATFDPAPVSRFLDDCPVVTVPGTAHPLRVEYAPGQSVARALDEMLPATSGQVLCFLPGAGEIERAAQEATGVAAHHDVDLVPLHGSLDADAQDRALQSSMRRRVVLATNIAETSLTVPGASVVIDTGLQKVARYDAERAIDELVLERVSRDSADQRAGRAARLGPGVVRRLWDERDRLRPEREPEIRRVDLAATLLGILAAGHRPDTFEWYEVPSSDRIALALSLLRRLGAVSDLAVTPLGHQLRRLPLHPRLGRVLLAGGGSFQAAAACALLSEPRTRPAGSGSTSCDLLPLIDRWQAVPLHTRQVAEHLQRLAADVLRGQTRPRIDDRALCQALFLGYPDRLARRRPQDRTRVTLSSGRGAAMGRESQVVEGDWLVALDLTGGRSGAHTEALVRMAAMVDAEWIDPTERIIEHRLEEAKGAVAAFDVERYDTLVVRERPVAPDPAVRAALLARAWLERNPDEMTARLMARARFGTASTLQARPAAATTARAVSDICIRRAALEHAVHWTRRPVVSSAERTLSAVVLPRRWRRRGGDRWESSAWPTPHAWASPVPVVFELLAPNGRPVQTTRDLRSFWERTYPEVRRSCAGDTPGTRGPRIRGRPHRRIGRPGGADPGRPYHLCMRFLVRALLLLVVLAALAGGVGWILAGREAGPTIVITSPDGFIGLSAALEMTVATPTGQLSRVEAVLEQNGQQIPVYSREGSPDAPEGGEAGTPTSLAISQPLGKKAQPTLVSGQARLVVTAVRPVFFGLRTATSTVTRDLQVRLEPPRVSVASLHHFINLGGAEFVVLRATPDDVEAGVRVGDAEYPAYPGSAVGLPDASTRVAFFALRYDQDVNTPIAAFARDQAGNQVSTPIEHRPFPKPFVQSKIPIDQRFLDRVVPAIASQTPDLNVDTSSPVGLLQGFLAITGRAPAEERGDHPIPGREVGA